MKPAILSMLVATKLIACALTVIASLSGTEARLDPSPATTSVLSEPLSGGYRRKLGFDLAQV